MSMTFGNFNQVEDSNNNSYDLIPKKTKANFICSDVKIEPTKAGNGYICKAEFTITDGPYEDRKIWQNFTLAHTNPQAVEIGLRDVKSWTTAVFGSAQGDITEESINALEGQRFSGVVGIEKSKNPQYEDRNKIVRFESVVAGGTAQAPMASQSVAPQPQNVSVAQPSAPATATVSTPVEVSQTPMASPTPDVSVNTPQQAPWM